MTPNLYLRSKQKVQVGWYWCLSFRKRDWKLSDYPISIHTQETKPEFRSSRFKSHRYVARIVNWWLNGTGDTKDEAMHNLSANFTNVKAIRADTGKTLPRPGTHEPIEFASGERVYAHPELAEDFIHRVLGLDWAFLSDESSLWDFHEDDTNDAYFTKIKEVYGVEVSDIESGSLSEILERIADMRPK